ncbi:MULTISPECIES: YfhH family protein [unclassified Exiguobacterium]|uniref:YfhH family protein n=1 Tax=unclassified Exiguobacterium TaxID=2644629 RepID=UPI001BEB7B0D|nr:MULTISPECIES: YfhH family protein [unclassified Exiguobacterium]
MEKRLSDLSIYELEQEIQALHERKRKAEQMGMVSEIEVVLRRIAIAESYLVDPSSFRPGETYVVNYNDLPFRLKFVNGVMGWGTFEGDMTERAIPLSELSEVEQ